MHQHGALDPAATAHEFSESHTGQRAWSTGLSVMRAKCT